MIDTKYVSEAGDDTIVDSSDKEYRKVYLCNNRLGWVS